MRWVLVFVAVVATAAIAAWLMAPAATPTAPPIAAALVGPDLGQRIYARCQACHGVGGLGVSGMTPGLAGNPRVVGDQRPLIRVVLNGLRGGAKLPMVGFAQQLSDAEIAAVLTHVRQTWGNAASPVEPAAVTVERAASHPGPWTAAELGW